MKKAMQMTLVILTIAAFMVIAEKGVRKNEQRECEQWQKESVEFRLWYATDWQIAQCQNYGIELKKFEPKKETTITLASWYDYDLTTADQKCSSEDCWSKAHRTCATRNFPKYSTLVVKNFKNGKQVECFVNDYGPNAQMHPEREVDLSSFAFSQIADLSEGLVEVEVWIK